MELNLSACIVTYNDCDEALRAAASVLEHTRRHPLTLYLVGNASPDVLAAADVITLDNNHDGVAAAIETYVLHQTR